MPFAAALSEHPLPTHATGEVVGQVLEQIGNRPDLALLFVTGPLVGVIEDIAATVRATLNPGTLIGATAVSVLAGAREVEEQSAVVLFAAHIGPVTPLRLRTARVADGWRVDGGPVGAPDDSTLLLLTDPFSFAIDGFLEELAISNPGLPVVGGMASAAAGAGGNRLVIDDRVVNDGAVGVLLPPGRVESTVVSQGCRPVGAPLVVTKAERNIIYEIAGRPALERLMALVEASSPEDRALMAQGIHVGKVMDERRLDFERGDFLIRQVLGADRSTQAIAVGDTVDVGETIQFHVRDADTADEDLRALLAAANGDAALVFTCNGRGTRLFDQPHHDASVVNDHVDGAATAGMFCAGEVGPVGDRNFVHGFTASVLLLRD